MGNAALATLGGESARHLGAGLALALTNLMRVALTRTDRVLLGRLTAEALAGSDPEGSGVVGGTGAGPGVSPAAAMLARTVSLDESEAYGGHCVPRCTPRFWSAFPPR